MVLLICLVILVACLAVLVKSRMETKAYIKRVQLEDERRMVAQNKLKSEIEQGIWEFPVGEFYGQCLKANAINLDNEYSVSKAKDIAMRLIKRELPSISIDSCSAYLNVEKMNAFLKEGQILHKAVRDEHIRKLKNPKNAIPTKQEKTFIARSIELKELTGNSKREKMLCDLISDYGAKITAIREGEEAMKTLGMIYLDQQQKESSWSIMGGIADGIAGPAAGLAVAMNTIANNAKIREYNASMRQTSMGILSGAAQLSDDRSVLEKERSKLMKLRSEAKKKISLSNPSAKVIWANININDISVKREKSGVLAVAANIEFKKPLTVNAPENVHLVVDGTLIGTVFHEDTEVGTVHLPLPLYGIPVNNTSVITLDGMCSRFVEHSGNYSVKFEDTQNLWVMEL